MDGVVFDMCRGVQQNFYPRHSWDEIHAKWIYDHPGEWNVHKLFGVEEKTLWKKIENASPGFWQGLDIYAGAADMLNCIQTYTESWCILSTPTFDGQQTSHKCIQGKLAGLLNILTPEQIRHNVLLGKPKHFCARVGTF